jgi:3-oxoacyl-ACP reductase-like protein
MRRRRANPWFGIGLDAWRLGLEASAVMGLRAMKIARGGADGEAEAKRMVSEKIEAAMDLQVRALTGGLGATPAKASARTIAHYRRKVGANRRRLTKA